MIYAADGNRLTLRRGTEFVVIEPWGKDSLRVRATRRAGLTGRDWALMEPVPELSAEIEIARNTSARPKSPASETGVSSARRTRRAG